MSDAADFASISVLPDVQKRELCLQLLEEFGADEITESSKGELKHRCTLPLPGHTDRDSVTASINYKKLTFSCFVCQNKGGFLWWIAVNRRTSTTEAKKWLQQESGVSDVMDLSTMMKFLEAMFHHHKDGLDPIPTYNDSILRPWRDWPIFHPYLTEPLSEGGREIPVANLEHFEIGYCDEDPDWRYHQRIIIPLRWESKLVGWQARKLWADDPEPAKYLNSPGTPRDRILYGDVEQQSIVLVESPMSVLRHTHHQPMIATMGASISELQVKLMHRYREVVFWMDNDKAGYTALLGSKSTPGLFDKLEPYCKMRVVSSPYLHADPADMDEDEVDDLISKAVPHVLWSVPKQADLIPHPRLETADGDS